MAGEKKNVARKVAWSLAHRASGSGGPLLYGQCHKVNPRHLVLCLRKNMKLMQILPLTISTKTNRILIRKKISIKLPIPKHIGTHGPSENSTLSTFRSKKYPHGDLVFFTIIEMNQVTIFRGKKSFIIMCSCSKQFN